ncbi:MULTISPECIES: tRNA 2-thiouridine(34) synthase MnmA [Nocardiopsidaceae]|uniref:tRNA-specific 2-thiouridylase MnmA n=1 Tax=Streptomonospora nanhaiensis TaxID=1323731 RepID=A0ABY6YKH6_9ACTN|nr:tRNA 2-thiouridine(34) synthase MnmA [Streptomonospora nanhaiensis]WAE72711.1 tRNA 2-thiouridine(34) synthase MnmA [Streptomonospora nanhaiensis]
MTLRVLAAMSGGVDSAVAAARVAEAGHDVTGVHLALSKNPQSYRTGARGCCTVEDSHDARRAADVIGIPFYVWDMSEEFDREVVQDFVAEYEAGNTPNPCLRCNEKIKFEAVLDRAVALGFDAVATGHHVRKVDGRLVRSVDRAKDQSYVLGVLDAGQLEHAMFPLGDCTKDEVRAEAERRGLSVADKPDSHDICFIADGDTAGFLNRRIGERPGPIQDEDGNVVGTHNGSHTFTIGQRKGLGLGGAPDPRYVLSIEPVGNTVTVGPRASLRVDGITGVRPVWSGSLPPAEPIECRVQLRAHGEVYPATVWQREGAEGAELVVRLAEPATGVATGQAVVVYEGDTVLGSATISSTSRAAASV